MRYEFSYQVTDELMRTGARRFILHHFGWRVPIAIAILALLLIPICGSSDHFMCGIFVGAVVLLVALMLLTWLMSSWRGVQMARKLATRDARAALTDEGIEVENALARSVIKWPLVHKVVRTPQVWLFFLARHQYFALPADKLEPGARTLIEGHVKKIR